MWFFMISCYVMSVVTFLMLLLAFVQSIFNFHIFQANHVTFIILTCIIYSFTETLIIFFFVGTGVSIKEYSQERHLGDDYRRRSLTVKRKIYPPLMLNMLFMIILFVLVGAVDTHRVPALIYQAFFLFCIVDYARIKIGQNVCFRDNTRIILDMSGIKTA